RTLVHDAGPPQRTQRRPLSRVLDPGPAGTDSATRHRCDEVRPGRSPCHLPSMVSALDCLVYSTLVMTSSDFSRVPTPTVKTMAVTMKQASSPQPKVSNPRLPSP